MKIAANIAGGLLGLLFIVVGSNFFLNFLPMPPPPPADTPVGMFMGAVFGTGFMAMVKVFELVGGVLVAIPRLRPLGLLILTPIIVNIIAFHMFVARAGVFDPPVLLVTALAAFLIWVHRRGVAALLADKT
ncbi:MAG TPA: hypothetical protein PKE12_07985 [Kiritimatiellia bacterium]|nr:hypothetical protein [Kiritimatiellia bacterium]